MSRHQSAHPIRYGQEASCRDLKADAWQWHTARLSTPAHAPRFTRRCLTFFALSPVPPTLNPFLWCGSVFAYCPLSFVHARLDDYTFPLFDFLSESKPIKRDLG